MSVSVEDFILNVVQQIESNVQNAAQQATLDTVLGAANATLSQVNAGIVASNNNFETVLIALNRIVSLIQQIQIIQPQPVNLPPAPPGYGGAAAGDVATAVWTYLSPFSPSTLDYLISAGQMGIRFSDEPGVLFYAHRNPFFFARAHWNSTTNFISFDDNLDLFNTSDLFSHASLLAWLNAHKGTTFSVNPDFDPGRYVVRDLTQSPSVDLEWVTTMTESQWATFVAGAAHVTAPVWPGLANVTLGTTLTLSDGLVVPGPLDGLLLTVSSVSYPVSFYPFGTHKSFVKVGAVVFVDDNGQLEHSQSIGLDTQVLCPLVMNQAASAIVRLKSGTVGTVRPWLTA